MLLLTSCILAEASADSTVCPRFPSFPLQSLGMQNGLCHCVTRPRGRWPQEELVATGGADRLLSALLLNAEGSKPGVKYTGGRGALFQSIF